MIYQKGDKFLYKETECVVVYTNGRYAWLATTEEPYVAIASIGPKGNDVDGNKATVIVNTECLAV